MLPPVTQTSTRPSSGLDRFFQISERGSTVGREVRGGVVTFLTMAYIVVVNPGILSSPGTGIPFNGALTATVLVASSMTLLMGLYARLPFAVAPGMGLNAFFAFTIIIQQQVPWQRALGMVFWAGVLFLIVSVTPVRERIATAPSPQAACDAIRPAFAELLADPAWLPERYQEGDPESGMGGGIGQWLLFRAGDRSLTLFALVVPSGSQTPVHDHLAWGLVGLYRGTQDEEIYARDNAGVLTRSEARALQPGDFYALLPPRDDIHRVRTTSPETSVSLHLLTNDTGCVWRHAFDEHTGEETPFRSGYVNVECPPA